MGIHRWSSTTMKTVEGSLGFIGSVVLSAWVLRLAGSVESFSVCFYLGDNGMGLISSGT